MALRIAAFLLGLAICIVLALVDVWSERTMADRLTIAVCAAPWLVGGLRATVMGAWIHEPSRRLRVITWSRRHRYDFDDVLDVRTDEKRGAIYPAVVRKDGSKVEIPMLQRSAFLGDLLVSRPDDYEPYLRRIRVLMRMRGEHQR